MNTAKNCTKKFLESKQAKVSTTPAGMVLLSFERAGETITALGIDMGDALRIATEADSTEQLIELLNEAMSYERSSQFNFSRPGS